MSTVVKPRQEAHNWSSHPDRNAKIPSGNGTTDETWIDENFRPYTERVLNGDRVLGKCCNRDRKYSTILRFLGSEPEPCCFMTQQLALCWAGGLNNTGVSGVDYGLVKEEHNRPNLGTGKNIGSANASKYRHTGIEEENTLHGRWWVSKSGITSHLGKEHLRLVAFYLEAGW